MQPSVDLRSDTVTRPTAALRRAMAEAEVGDDVYGEDPTVRRLEAETARLLGKEDALFMPTGCMGNQVAVRLWTHPGEEVALGHQAHSYDWELAGLAALGGVQARPLPTERGVFQLEDVRTALRPAGGFRPACRLLMVENTHNFQGGAVVPLEHLEALRQVALERGARVHLDGARLWNACAASGVEPAAYASTADSVMVCYSKGLGAPSGSALVGERGFIARAREVRKLLGGGMRQVGVLAAPALLALQSHRARLVEDHARARRLAEALAGLPGVVLLHAPVETNIVFVRLPGRDALALKAELAAQGVLVGATGPDTLRMLTHLDVDDAGLERALGALRRVLAA
ncbi:MAG: GntG family PLP-dependent aldolase [Planctomycetia bacterium]